jgi:mannose-6-phosphate isomerase-like protein (cupin superfamily)
MGGTVIRRPGEGKVLTARGAVLTFKASSDETGGAFSLFEREVPPGGQAPPAHVHSDCEEAFYVLEGEFEFRLGDRVERVGPGGFVLVQRGAAHTFANAGSRGARILILHAPGKERYFEELAELTRGGPPDPEAMSALMRRHGMEPA